MKNSGSEVDEAGQSLLDSIGAAFVQFRQEAGLTQRQVAHMAESSQARISGLENGKADIFLMTLLRWANVYGYTMEINFVPVEDDQEEFEDGLAAMLQEIEEEGNAEIQEESDRVGS